MKLLMDICIIPGQKQLRRRYARQPVAAVRVAPIELLVGMGLLRPVLLIGGSLVSTLLLELREAPISLLRSMLIVVLDKDRGGSGHISLISMVAGSMSTLITQMALPRKFYRIGNRNQPILDGDGTGDGETVNTLKYLHSPMATRESEWTSKTLGGGETLRPRAFSLKPTVWTTPSMLVWR